METVQLQCGSCNKIMAISTQHLGGQVRCPHCQAVVQTPPRPQPAAVAVDIPPLPPVEPREVESIFAPPEPTDDLFDGGPQRPLVEMPAEVPRPIALTPAPLPSDAMTVDAPSPLFSGSAETTAVAPPEAPPEGDEELQTFQ